MGRCHICGLNSRLISDGLGLCLRCIRERPDDALQESLKVHTESRSQFGLPSSPPKDPEGIACDICMNKCRIGPGKRGFCGLVSNIDGRLTRFGGTPEKGNLEWYYDPLPTNCVAWWFCAGCTGLGYPKYAYKAGAEIGYSNLAVFYGACSFDCLFCQNWHYRALSSKLHPVVSAENLAAKVQDTVSCICYFGGDPSPQMPHALRTSEIALERAKEEGRILRICWETNGYMNGAFADRAAKLSFESGGTVKFDIKTFSETLNQVLCGVSNKPTLDSFRRIGEKFFRDRLEPPVLTASTLLIPGYIDAEEVGQIANFLAGINPKIPYTLLAFYPQYVMHDLPPTSRQLALECFEAAKKAELEQIKLGNIHLLA